MKKTIVLKQNSEAIRKQIEEAEIELCPCASFIGSKWLEYSDITPSVHGVGYPFGDETLEQNLRCFEAEVKDHAVWCKNVDEFIKEIKNYDKTAYCSNETVDMKTITDYANDYVGHPQEIDEDLSVYSKREAYKAGMNKAFELIIHEIDINKEAFIWSPVLYLGQFINKMQGKEG